ncbi:cache domain-containing protein [Paenibacillus sp. N3.4]|uniref:cache domain-containing protein n=1 Tax=Paenibacillus sp. N3.4 TaxID=2603222 RepID=UPI001C9CEC05|nr:cache domain-containing protein [Paenibacillus sp. N3.4]
MKLIDQSLSAIDQSIINEIIADHSSIRDFFTPQQEINPLFQTYGASLELNNLVLKHAIIDSIYLYRNSDQAILSKNRFIPLSEFGDKEFLQAQLTGDVSLQSWSGSRQYVEFSSQTEPISVITLVRSVILFSGEEGKIVTNVKITALQKILQDLFDSGISYAELVDGEGNVILSRNGSELERAKQKPTEMYLSDIHSPITNWHLRSGVEAGKVYYFISNFSYIWLIIGLSIVALGVIWIVYITRRNYRPVELMINQIQSLSFKISQKLATYTGGNQLSFIENAVENLIEESNKFQQRHEENIVFRKKYFFKRPWKVRERSHLSNGRTK